MVVNIGAADTSWDPCVTQASCHQGCFENAESMFVTETIAGSEKTRIILNKIRIINNIITDRRYL